MSDPKSDPDVERETVVIERGSSGGIVATVALVIALIAVLHYFDLLPF